MAITETWLHNNIFNNEILPPGYNIHRNDRCSKGGGILLAIKNNLICKLLSTPAIEALAVTICGSKSLTLAVVYIPPNSPDSYHTSVLNFIHSLPHTNDLIILGDFNYPNIDWQTLYSHNHHSSAFCDLIIDLNLWQLIDSPTHSAGNILDLVLTNNDAVIHNLSANSILPPNLTSDHFTVEFNIVCTPTTSSNSTRARFYYNYTKADWDGMLEFLTHYNFNPLYSLTDINSKPLRASGLILKYSTNSTVFIPSEGKLKQGLLHTTLLN